MMINRSLAMASDITLQISFIIYSAALFASLVNYWLKGKELEAARARQITQPLATSSLSMEASSIPPLEKPNKDKARFSTFLLKGLIWSALVFHGASWALRGISAQRFPLGNLFEYSIGLTFITGLVASFILNRGDRLTLWPWVLTPYLALLFYGSTKLYTEATPVVPALQSNWIPIHVTIVVLGASLGLLSGIASLLYLLRYFSAQTKHTFLTRLTNPLPNADALDSIAYGLAIVALPTFGLGILFGAIWAEAAWGRFWGWDPKETVALISWILYAVYLHARATSGWKQWKAALINIVALATMIFNLFFINMVVSGLHSYAGLN